MSAKISDIAGLPTWPRGLSAEQAAAYVGVTEPTFRRLIEEGVFPEGVRYPTINRVVWDKQQVDEAFSKITRSGGGTGGGWDEWQESL